MRKQVHWFVLRMNAGSHKIMPAFFFFTFLFIDNSLDIHVKVRQCVFSGWIPTNYFEQFQTGKKLLCTPCLETVPGKCVK